MGKPALRIGDLTAHGGTVTVGKPTILIGKMPASTLGDMHVCPMLTGPVPHVGGPAIMGSTGVLLSKMPGARVSDPHVCVGPPSMGAMGCMTVPLGEAGSGGDAGNAAAAASAASMSKKGPKAISPFPVAEPPTPRTENHYLECKVTDDAEFVLTGIKYKIKDPDGKDVIGSSSFEGRVRHDGYVQAGSFKIEFPAIAKVKWPSLKNKPHEKLKLEASVTGFADGTEAFISVFEERDRGKYKRLLVDLKSKVASGKVEVEWTFAKEHYPLPKQDESKMHALEEKPEGKIEYFFFVVVEGCIGVSKKAQFLDDAEIAVVDKDKKPMANEEYKIRLVDGTMRSGKLDKDGKAKVKDIPVGHYELDLVKLVKSLESVKKPDVAKQKMPEAKSGEKAKHRRKGQKAEGKKTESKENNVSLPNSNSNTKTISEEGIKMIMKFEGFRAMPYNDSVGHATIGYGTLLHKGNVSAEDKKNYPAGISKEEAKKLLMNSVREMEPKLLSAVKVDLNQNQFDALMGWTYNLGTGHLVESKCSWLRNLNQGHYDKVPEGLLLWNKALNEKGQMIELPGLTTRRQAEADLFKK